MRITDDHGHLWPITGHRCPVCRMPADPALAGAPHPGCDPGQPFDDQRWAAALNALPTVPESERWLCRTGPVDRWLVSGAALPTAPPAGHPDDGRKAS